MLPSPGITLPSTTLRLVLRNPYQPHYDPMRLCRVNFDPIFARNEMMLSQNTIVTETYE